MNFARHALLPIWGSFLATGSILMAQDVPTRSEGPHKEQSGIENAPADAVLASAEAEAEPAQTEAIQTQPSQRLSERNLDRRDDEAGDVPLKHAIECELDNGGSRLPSNGYHLRRIGLHRECP